MVGSHSTDLSRAVVVAVGGCGTASRKEGGPQPKVSGEVPAAALGLRGGGEPQDPVRGVRGAAAWPIRTRHTPAGA